MLLELATVIALSQRCAPQVAPETLAAVARVESRFNPYAIGVNGSSRLAQQPRSKDEAIRIATRLLARGENIDLGIGQINSSNMEWLGLSVADAFDPCKNLAAAGRVLTTNYRSVAATAPTQQHALRVALSMYNTGSQTRGFRNGYVRKVEDAAHLLAGGSAGRPPIINIERAPLQADADPTLARVDEVAAAALEAQAAPEVAHWDVFGRAAGGAVTVFGGPAQ